jgi:uncharacterized protein YjbI with pentapeptide repeats
MMVLMIQYHRYEEPGFALNPGEDFWIEQRTHPGLTKALRTADWNAFTKIRLVDLSLEGRWFRLIDEDLSGLDLRGLPAEFLSFHHCDFRGANVSGVRFFPASFKDCDLRGIDLSDATGVIYMLRCDLRGAFTTGYTNFFPRPEAEQPSELESCRLDESLKSQLERQEVRFKLRVSSQYEF